ncbi:MAG: type II toxin-antitoxin system RelE/ParE family toxin [Chloroflexia bacterium]
MKIAWSEQSRRDITEAVRFWSARDPVAALRTSQTIRRQVALLKAHPELGRPGRVVDTRELVVPKTPYVVIYTVDSPRSLLIILRILRSARNWPASADEDEA